MSTKMIGYGLMGFTWRAQPVADEVAFPAMRSAVANGALYWSSAAFYGPPSDPLANIKLVKRYFDRYPDDAEKVHLFVKGCFDGVTFTPQANDEQIRASLKSVQDVLGSSKTNLYFGPGRKDPKVPLKTQMQTFKSLIDEGAIKGVFLSEVGAESVQEAHAVQPISALEVEFSIFSPDLLKNGVAEVTKANKIPILAYSPLGRGLLTGAIKTQDQIPEGDVRGRMERFQGDNLKQNVELASRIASFGKSLGATPAQVAIAWIHAHADQAGSIIPIPAASNPDRVKENCTLIALDQAQLAELDQLAPQSQVAGHRASAKIAHTLWA